MKIRVAVIVAKTIVGETTLCNRIVHDGDDRFWPLAACQVISYRLTACDPKRTLQLF